MNYTAVDIERLHLKKDWFCGYSKVQTDRVLDKIKEDYYELTQQISELGVEAEVMRETVQHYKMIEESLQHTLILAHSTSEEIKKNAAERAGNIIFDAELKAKKMIDEAVQKVTKIQSEYEELKQSLSLYKIKTQSLLSTLQELLQPTDE